MEKSIALILLLSQIIIADTLTITFGVQQDTYSFELCSRYIQTLNSQLSKTKLKLVYQPFERSVISLLSEKTDGDFLRSAYVYSDSDPIIKIHGTITPDPVTYYLFALPSYFDTVSIIPSKNSKYICTLHNRTIKAWLEKNNLSYTMVRDYRQVVGMIEMGRVDCLIGASGYNYEPTIKKAGIVQSKDILFQDTLYLFLHEKHKEAALEIEQAIQKMEKDSLYLNFSPYDTSTAK